MVRLNYVVAQLPNPLFQAFFNAGVEAGYNKTPDVNGFRQEGFGPFDSQVHNGRRVSASRAYLHPAMKRKNLDVQNTCIRY
ncbi:choline dehydrogenase [Staphylococcus gallinarum]|uniref:Choline dehydrogenase n=1 Tax=Staphylococcus gallinarum TaxID=1293 RepID=A0A380FP04_STAGA|nr:choline dehydrogenase [Staphylococcus gallinarum]